MKNKTKTLLVFDGNHCGHRAYHAMGRMSFNGKGTGVIFGGLQILFAATTRFKPNKIISCFDDGRNAHRLKILPTYKERVQKIDFDGEAFHKQMKSLMTLFRALGIPQLYAPGQEADDFIYSMVKKYEALGWKVIIVSGDKDFRQLVSKKVWIFDNVKGLIHPKNFHKHFGLEPKQYADFLCLNGDVSDKIPGVPGIGEITALKILKEHSSIKSFLGNGANAKHPKYTKIREVYQINRKLINLKVFDDLFGPQKLIYYKGQRAPVANAERYLQVCSKYGIKKFTTNTYLNTIP